MSDLEKLGGDMIGGRREAYDFMVLCSIQNKNILCTAYIS